MVYMGGKNSKKRGQKSESFTPDLIPTTKVIEPSEDDYSHPPEIQNFIKNHRWAFPCSLLFKNNEFQTNNNFFNKIPLNKIAYYQKNSSKLNITKIERSSNSTENLLIQNDLDINTIHNEYKFKLISDNAQEQTIKEEVFFYKYILAELTILPEDISLRDQIKKELKDLVESDEDEFQKAKYIDEQFKEYGFYIPLKIEIGGMFSVKIDNLQEDSKSNLKRNFDANTDYIYGKNTFGYGESSEQTIKNIFSQASKDIKGGDVLENDFEKWKKSITIDNAEIIGYSSFTKLTKFFNEFKNNLSQTLKILDRKYEARKKFYEIIEDLKKKKSHYYFKDRKDTYQEGICSPRDYPKIECLNNEQKGDGEFAQQIKRRFSSTFEYIIVGWKIISVWKDGTNGTWSLDKNPLLTNSIDVFFKSKPFRGQRFRIELWMMSLPDEDWTCNKNY